MKCSAVDIIEWLHSELMALEKNKIGVTPRSGKTIFQGGEIRRGLRGSWRQIIGDLSAICRHFKEDLFLDIRG